MRRDVIDENFCLRSEQRSAMRQIEISVAVIDGIERGLVCFSCCQDSRLSSQRRARNASYYFL